VLAGLVGLALLTLGAAKSPIPEPRPDSVPPRRPVSVKDSPGYVPLLDPESLSVALGRRTNAPRVSRRFAGGAASLDDLGRAICRALHHASRDSLTGLCVSQREFCDILWREFPQSRPATGIPCGDAWFFVMTRNRKGCTQAVRDLGGRYYELLHVQADSIARYRNFRLYSRLTLVVRGDANDTLRWGWVKAVAERKGSFKIFSVRD